jgi:hypothetical protein
MNEETKRALQSMRGSFMRAAPGPLLTTTLVPLTNQGNLRITYTWFHSALNCDPNDGSSFLWAINKLDDIHVALSPTDCTDHGRPVYASVRDDYDWFVQVQAGWWSSWLPVGWITAINRDEVIRMQSHGLNIVQFQGFNGQNIAVNTQITSDRYHSGYRMQSTGSSNPQASLFFMGVTKLLQPGLQVRLASEMTPDDIRQAYASCDLTASDDDVGRMMKAIG